MRTGVTNHARRRAKERGGALSRAQVAAIVQRIMFRDPACIPFGRTATGLALWAVPVGGAYRAVVYAPGAVVSVLPEGNLPLALQRRNAEGPPYLRPRVRSPR